VMPLANRRLVSTKVSCDFDVTGRMPISWRLQRSANAGLTWDNKESAFSRWCEGSTGFPIVDAGMRELNATGFRHNRLRMIVAMFLTKDLHIHRRKGEQYFLQKLVDGDIAANNGGWQ
jgi:deoxyribodipyrimidine photo-lyase